MTTEQNQCVFCTCPLTSDKLSPEHVFLSAIGGRLTTKTALCDECNNAFATSKTGCADGELANFFILPRNLLRIWTGRGQPPPTIQRAGRFDDGMEFDCAPGYVPVSRRQKSPSDLSIETSPAQTLLAVDELDASRHLDILKSRGYSTALVGVVQVVRKAPAIKATMNANAAAVSKSVAKLAVVAACILYGNQQVRSSVLPGLREAARFGKYPIARYVSLEYGNTWPAVAALVPLPKYADAVASGFEHMVCYADVGDHWVAFVEFFGGFRFSVLLGNAAGLPPKGLAVNPRATTVAPFHVTFTPPQSYRPPLTPQTTEASAKDMAGLEHAITRVKAAWERESLSELSEHYAAELQQQIDLVGDDEAGRAAVIEQWATKVATLEGTGQWSEPITLSFDEQ